jgi:hypothetical protein
MKEFLESVSRKLFFGGGDEKHSQGRGVHLPCTFSQKSSMFDDNKHHVSFYQVMICSRERDFGMIRIYLTERTKWEQNLVTNLKDCAIGETIGSEYNEYLKLFSNKYCVYMQVYIRTITRSLPRKRHGWTCI